MEELRGFSKYLILIVAIIGTIMFKGYRNTKAKYFLYSVWFAVITEFVGSLYIYVFDRTNFIVYNIFTLVQITFYLWWVRSLLKSNNRRQIINYFIILFWIANVVEFSLMPSMFEDNTKFVFALGVIFLVIAICYYYIEIFNSEKVLNIRGSVYFWFTLGVLLFYATFLPFFISTRFFIGGDIVPLSLATLILNIIMNTCFLIGFFKAKQSAKEHKLV